MNSVMLDLETMGNGSDAAIIAIGAVRFADGEITDRFYSVVDLESSISAGLKVDAGTVLWWMQQSDEARKQFETKGHHLAGVLVEFSHWLGEGAEVWGNGASFDNAILATAYRKCGMKQPWEFWNDRCYRTVKSMNRDIEMERIGTYHNAVDDAESQALHLMRILAR